MNKERKIVIKSSKDQHYLVEQFIDNIADEFNITNTYFGNILISVLEAVDNAVIHGNNSDINKNIIIEFYQETKGLVFSISDEGKGFDILSIPDPTDIKNTDITKGRGIYLIKSLADDVRFLHNGSKIELVFYISSINSELSLRRVEQLTIFSKAFSKEIIK